MYGEDIYSNGSHTRSRFRYGILLQDKYLRIKVNVLFMNIINYKWTYVEIGNRFAFMDFKKNMKSPGKETYISAILLYNFYCVKFKYN